MHQKYKANENKSKHNPKKKQKQTINNNQVKTLCKEDSWLQKDLNYSSTTRKKIADWPPPRMDGIKAWKANRNLHNGLKMSQDCAMKISEY